MGQSEAKVWLIWLIVVLVSLVVPSRGEILPEGTQKVVEGVRVETAVVVEMGKLRDLFPWLPPYRWRKLGLIAYQRWRRAYRRARYRFWVAYRLAKIAHKGTLTLAWVLDWLVRGQLCRHMGALPVLYAVLKELKVEETINQYCASRCEVSHGLVGLILILNRLHAPRAICRVADWLGRTVLVHTLGVEPAKFKKDRLGRGLDAMAPHCQAIWREVVNRAIERYNIDLSVIYYDLTAFIMHGEYQESDLVKYGFAHNTPSDKKKVKLSLNAAADAQMPVAYEAWPGRTADKATVEENMQRLAALLKKHAHPLHQALIVGDRAMLDDRLALLYDEKGLRYLAGLSAQKKVHRQLVAGLSEAELRRYPVDKQRGRYGYWAKPVTVPFRHEGQQASHRGLVILSGPMRFSRYRSRAKAFRALWQAFAQVQAKADAGKAKYRSPAQVQARAETQCRQHPKVGKFVSVQAHQQGERIVLTWQVKVEELKTVMHKEGRYLIVTNDPQLSNERMFELYRAKDGVEKDFRISKSQLKVSPLFLHKDERIQTMLLMNMLALLTYTILERQVRQSGLALTARRIIERLDNLNLIETHCVDGSCHPRLTPISQEQNNLILALHAIFPQVPTPFPNPTTPPKLQIEPALPDQLRTELVL